MTWSCPAFQTQKCSHWVNIRSKCSKEQDIRYHDMEASGKTLHGSVTHSHALDVLPIGWSVLQGIPRLTQTWDNATMQVKNTFIQFRSFMRGVLGWDVIMETDDPIGWHTSPSERVSFGQHQHSTVLCSQNPKGNQRWKKLRETAERVRKEETEQHTNQSVPKMWEWTKILGSLELFLHKDGWTGSWAAC